MSKTPVTTLQEICLKHQKSPPFYDLVADGTETNKVFAYSVTAFNESAVGSGRSKMDAKHDAAVLLLRKLDQFNFSDDSREAPPAGEGNSVGDLLDICVQRNMPLPQFNLVNATGPSHSPNFTYECRVAHVIRLASHSTKKGAKQLVASKLLQIVQEVCLIRCFWIFFNKSMFYRYQLIPISCKLLPWRN